MQEALSLMDNTTEGAVLKIIVFQVLAVYYQFNSHSIDSAYFSSNALQECRTLRETHAHLLVVPAMQSMGRTTTDERKRSPHTVALLNQPLELQVIFLVREVTKQFAHMDIDKSLGNVVLKMLTDIESELGNRTSPGLFSLHRMVVLVLGILCKSDDARIVIVRERIRYHIAALEQYKQNSSEKNDKQNPATSCEMHKDALAKSYLDIGFAHRDKKDFELALHCEHRALEIRLEQYGGTIKRQLIVIFHLVQHNMPKETFPHLFTQPNVHSTSPGNYLETNTLAQPTAQRLLELYNINYTSSVWLYSIKSVHWTLDWNYLEKSIQAQLTAIIPLGLHNMQLET